MMKHDAKVTAQTGVEYGTTVTRTIDADLAAVLPQNATTRNQDERRS